MAAKVKPRRAGDATGAGNAFQASAGSTRHITRKNRAKEARAPYRITPNAGDPFRIAVTGRVRWALDRLRAAGAKGCTPITEPAPRWAAYVHSLRELGVPIETVTEAHDGAFAGTHARYVLRCKVCPLEDEGGDA